MKKIVGIVLILIFVSCTSALEKKYKESSKEEDLVAVSEKISSNQFKILKNYISELETKEISLSGKTYKNLLQDADNHMKERLRQIEKEKRKEEERLAAEKLEKARQYLITKLCVKKWRIKEYDLRLKILNNSMENIEKSKMIIKRAMYLKDPDLSISVKNIDNKTFVIGKYGDKLMKMFFESDNESWKQYLSDGTYIDKTDDEVVTGTWEIIEANKIKERRPSTTSFLKNKKEVYIIDIKRLDENIFHFHETEYFYIEPESTISSSFVMKAVKKR